MKTILIGLLACGFVAVVQPSPARDKDDKAVKKLSESQIERMHKRNKRKAEEAWARDAKKRSRDEMAAMEKDYQEINAKYKDPEIMEILERFLKKYKEGNRVGCATMYLAQKSGSATREKVLQKAIDDFSDAYYLDGCNVGGLARLYLASHYKKMGDDRKAEKLIDEIEKDYEDAQDHSGKPIIDMRANSGGGCDHYAVFARFIAKGEFWGRVAGGGERPFPGPLVVIVDASTASAGETLAGQFGEDQRAIVIGSSGTAGMSSQKVRLPAPSGLCSAYFSVRSNKGRFNGGRGLEGIGVIPHEIVPYRSEELASGIDSQIRRAEELLAVGKWPEFIDYDGAAFRD